ncbi:Dynein regulatory complex protein 1 [Eumeta japonica]|uniref:Dynein regulatory complex protein 1 n=1 Tax=Eumeta variegata TaxID=151549 RepID=A0A4C1TRW7_EUMVA|nr:Dynein regulatory complex protein 1 [Eumeta japonica]
MANRFGAEDDEDILEPKEPQITSEDPAERKTARALRIKKRQEALKRAEQPLDEVVQEEAPGPVELATTQAVEELQRLSAEGVAQVTNVKVTTDERECIRRLHLSDHLKLAYERMEDEAVASQVSYEAITANWDKMLEIRDPLDAEEAMQQQRERCDRLLAKKDELIDYLKQDLKQMDEDYYEGLDIQNREIKELSDRVENQLIIMQKAYDKQLYLIDQATVIEREAMVHHNNKRWKALYRQREKEELQHIEYKCEQLEAFKEEMDTIMWDHYDKYREAKIELESLINDLQKELEKLKSTCLINGEKIAYNYQILKKREEENVFVRSQQKRKLNKMSDVVNGLRTKIRKAAEDGAAEEIRANDEIVKLLQAMADLEKKSEHFSHVNDYKFWQVWRMSVAKCSQLARELRQVEVALHAQVLAEPAPPASPLPKPIAVPFTEENKVILEVSGKSYGSNDVVEKVCDKLDERNQATEEVGERSDERNNKAKEASTENLSKSFDEKDEDSEIIESEDVVTVQAKQKLMRHILQLVADNTGFLLEDRLLKLIEKYQSTSRNLCTLDGIFMALDIQSEQDIELLCKTFLKYAYCPTCEGLDSVDEIEEQSSMNSPEDSPDETTDPDGHKIRVMHLDRHTARSRISTIRSTITAPSHVGNVVPVKTLEMSSSDQELVQEADEIMQKCYHRKVRVGVAAGAASTVGAVSSSTGVRARGVVLTLSSHEPQLARPVSPRNPYVCPALSIAVVMWKIQEWNVTAGTLVRGRQSERASGSAHVRSGAPRDLCITATMAANDSLIKCEAIHGGVVTFATANYFTSWPSRSNDDGGLGHSNTLERLLLAAGAPVYTRRLPENFTGRSHSCPLPNRERMRQFLMPVGHNLQIEPVQVLTALCEFTQDFVPPEKQRLMDLLDTVKPRQFETSSRRLKPEAIDEYWNKWKNVYPSEKDKFWDCLMSGLNSYLHMLQERERLHEELVELRRQHARLLGGALPQLPVSCRPSTRRWDRAFTAPREDRAPEPLPPI